MSNYSANGGAIFGSSPYAEDESLGNESYAGGSLVGLAKKQGWPPFQSTNQHVYTGKEATIRTVLEVGVVVSIVILFVSLFTSTDSKWARFSRMAVGFLIGSVVSFNALDATPLNDTKGNLVAVVAPVVTTLLGGTSMLVAS